MTFRGARKTKRILMTAGIVLAVSHPALGQDAGGLDARFTFSQGLEYSEDTGTIGRTDLGFDLSSVTKSQSLSFQIDTALEQGSNDSGSFELIDPLARLSYGIENRQTALSTDLSYRRSDADSFVEDPDGAPGVLVIDEGTREDTNARVDLEFGRDALFGGSVNFGFRALDYSDTTSTELVDTETFTGGIGLRFQVDPRITLTLDYNQTDTDRAVGKDSVVQRLNAGGQFAITPTLDASLSAGVSRIETTELGVSAIDEGLSYNFRLTQDRPVGQLRFTLSSDLSETGRRSSALFGGTLETRRGEWVADVGVSQGEDDTLLPLVTVSYGEELLRGGYSISLRQAFDTTSDGDETLNSRLALNLNHDLTQTSRMSSSLTYQMTDVLGQDDDSERLEIGLGYNQDLTDNWSLAARYTHTIVDQDTSARETDNEIFIGLETSLGWRP